MITITNNEFGEVESFNDHMHAQISHHRVDENYVDEICGLFFEIGTNCGNIRSAMFDEELKVESMTIVASYEAIVRIYHEVVRDLEKCVD